MYMSLKEAHTANTSRVILPSLSVMGIFGQWNFFPDTDSPRVDLHQPFRDIFKDIRVDSTNGKNTDLHQGLISSRANLSSSVVSAK
jgi:hypothetical protein